MKKMCLILLLCAMFFSTIGCSDSGGGFESNDASQTRDENDRWSDEDGGIIIESSPKKTNVTEVVYESMTPYFDNRILVQQAGRYGIIDNLGNIIMPITQTKPIEPVNMKAVTFLENGKFGLFSISGEVLVPACYDKILKINEDLIALQTVYEYWDWEDDVLCRDVFKDITQVYSLHENGFLNIDMQGNILCIETIDNLIAFNYNTLSSDGDIKTCTSIYTLDGELVYFSDLDGAYLTDASFYKTSQNKTYIAFGNCLLDGAGKIIYDLSDTQNRFILGDGWEKYYCDKILIEEYEENSKNYKYYSLDLNEFITEPLEHINNGVKVLEKIKEFYKVGIFAVNRGYGYYYGLMNDKYEVIAEPIYDSVEAYVNGYFPVELNEYVGYIDKIGNILHPQFEKDKIQKYIKFAYNYISDDDGGLIHPKTGVLLPYRHIEDPLKDSSGIYCAILNDEETGEEYKSFVTWDGPVVEHKFPNTKITVSRDGKIAVYNKGALYTIVELQ